MGRGGFWRAGAGGGDGVGWVFAGGTGGRGAELRGGDDDGLDAVADGGGRAGLPGVRPTRWSCLARWRRPGSAAAQPLPLRARVRLRGDLFERIRGQGRQSAVGRRTVGAVREPLFVVPLPHSWGRGWGGGRR